MPLTALPAMSEGLMKEGAGGLLPFRRALKSSAATLPRKDRHDGGLCLSNLASTDLAEFGNLAAPLGA